MINFIKSEIYNILENVQLADKIYFNTNKLTKEDKDFIYGITHGDNTTKLMCDLYYEIKTHREYSEKQDMKLLPSIYNQIKNYNKKVFPIKDFDIYNKNNKLLFSIFKDRGEIIKYIKQLPSIAVRNLKNDIQEERNYSDFATYLHNIEYFMSNFSLISNRDDKLKQVVYKKLFKSNITIEDLLNFVEEKENLLGGFEFTIPKLKNMVKNNDDMVIVYNKGSIYVVEVTSPSAIKEIGCNSVWCFTYGTALNDAYRQWNNYSHNGIVYVIVDFRLPSDSQDFMYVVIHPLDPEYDEDNEETSPLFNMSNEIQENPYPILDELVGKQNINKIFSFE